MPIPQDTAGRVLDASRDLMKARGWSAVSYTDVAQRVGIRSASIHHHFPAKADLGSALLKRYVADFMNDLRHLEEQNDPRGCLRGYLDIVRTAMAGGTALCLCTRLAADYQILPPAMQDLVTDFNRSYLDWLTGLLREGSRQGLFIPLDEPHVEARLVYAEVQGAQLIARSFADMTHFDTIADRIMERLDAAAPAKRS